MDTKSIQSNLNRLGYNCGTPDGISGPKTERAILDFSRDWNVSRDSLVVGIENALSGRSPTPEAARITEERFIAMFPKADPEWAEPLAVACRRYLITTPLRVSHFLAQCGHETNEFKTFIENLNYRDPVRLDKMFSAVKGTADARALIARGPQAIANRVYANRGGNRSEASGDGWRYRGMGVIQITLRDNYRLASKWTGVDLLSNPERILEPYISAMAAGGYWDANRINVHADNDDIRGATRAVNGPAMAGLDDRIKKLNKAKGIWK